MSFHAERIDPEPLIHDTRDEPLTEIQKQLVSNNINLVNTIALIYYKKYNHLLLVEFSSAGTIGLIDGIKHYIEDLNIDPENKRWLPYIRRFITSAMIDEMRNNRLIKSPTYLCNKKEKEIIQQRKKDYHEGITHFNKQGVPYDNLFWQDVERSASRKEIYSVNIEKKEISKDNNNIEKYLVSLNPIEKQIVLLKMDDLSNKDIADKLNISSQQCVILYNKALR
jgi:RNA polymerase sigma factor (sigma-70 family)